MALGHLPRCPSIKGTVTHVPGLFCHPCTRTVPRVASNFGMQPTALRAAADTARWAESESDLMRILLVFATFLSVTMSMAASAQTLGPLVSISPEEYLKLPHSVQTFYVAGVVDGVSVTSYGYSLPDHDAYVRCARTMTLGVLAQRVADWIRANPGFSEGAATAVSKTLAAHCKRPSTK